MVSYSSCPLYVLTMSLFLSICPHVYFFYLSTFLSNAYIVGCFFLVLYLSFLLLSFFLFFDLFFVHVLFFFLDGDSSDEASSNGDSGSDGDSNEGKFFFPHLNTSLLFFYFIFFLYPFLLFFLSPCVFMCMYKFL